MSDLRSYRALEQRHTEALADWVENTPGAKKALEDHIGEGRQVADYIDEYGHRFAIAAYLAQDLGHPEADAWLEDYYVFADLQEFLD